MLWHRPLFFYGPPAHAYGLGGAFAPPPFILWRSGSRLRAVMQGAIFLRRAKNAFSPTWLEWSHKYRSSLLGFDRAAVNQFFPRNGWHFSAIA